jgi:Cd2+/Zn2+-exporting ATPase
MNNDLRRLPFLVNLSRSTRTVINQNFLFGVLFIITGMTFAALGKVHPMLAAALHTVGSLIVVFNSARLVRKGEEMEHYQAESESRDSNRSATPSGLPQIVSA